MNQSRFNAVCSSFANKQTKRQRQELGFIEKPVRGQEEASLPFEEVRESLEMHPLVQLLSLDVAAVYGSLKQILYDDKDEIENAEDVESDAAVKRRGPILVACDFKCRECGEDMVTDHASGTHSCSNCGVCQRGSFIDYSNPYRYLEDKEDRRHFESASDHKVADPWPEIEHYGGILSLGHFYMEEARRLLVVLSKRKRISTNSAAATAAIIAATCPDLLKTHRVHPPTKPQCQFKCPICSEGVSTWGAARIHCRLGGVTSRDKPLKACMR